MAGQGTTAEVRVYRTVDGELVGEGDPRGAFLAYAPGHTVPAGEVDAYNALRAKSKADKANAGDADARGKLRGLLVGETFTPAGEVVPLMHDRLATELADEARALANAGPEAQAADAKAADPDAVVATRTVYRNGDGDLVHEGHPDAATLAYSPGDRVADADVDQFNDLGDPPAPETETPSGRTSGRAAKPAGRKA